MDRQLRANRNQLVQFLDAVQKINDSFIFDITEAGDASVITVTPDETLFLYGTTTFDESVNCSLNIPDVKKLGRALNMIGDDYVALDLTTNALKYKSKGTKFTYHLYDETFLKRPKIKADKVKAFVFDITVKVTKETIKQLVKNASFVDSANKLYLHTEDGHLKGEVTDKARMNTDSITMILAENVGVDINPIIIKLENIQALTMIEDEFDLKINTERGLVAFEFARGNNKLLYIITSLKQ